MLAAKTSVINFLDIKTAAQSAINENLSLPQQNDKGWYVTSNNFGFMFDKFDDLVKDFLIEIKSKKNDDFDILEIGCAYGNVVKAALDSGCKGYIANDIGTNHLKVLAHELVKQSVEKWDRKIKLLPGRFPDELTLPECSIRYGLMNKVLHFFQPNELALVMESLANVTIKGGKWFVLTATPQNANYKHFYPEYLKRKKIGMAYPGFCSDAGHFGAEQNICGQLPSSMLFLELPDLCKLFESYGFKITKTYSLGFPTVEQQDWQVGNDMVGIIAEKL